MKNDPWISTDVQARIEPPPTSLIKVGLEELHATHIIKVKMRKNPSQDISETYNMNMYTFNDKQPEVFIALLRNL